MTQQPTYGPHNPHPLSTLRTELVWEGKDDEYGDRREVDIAGCAIPMQRIERIDEPRRAAAATGQLELFEQQNSKQKVPLAKGDLGGSLRTVDIKLTQFLPSLAEVPTKALEAIKERAIKSGFDFIDFWAVDFHWQPGKPLP
ncbi:MAG: hypothetical protein WBA57_26950 [Elainellaceae cyanobacterium]